MRYVKSALKTVKEKKVRFAVVTLAVMLVFSAIGYMKAKKDIAGEAERQVWCK